MAKEKKDDNDLNHTGDVRGIPFEIGNFLFFSPFTYTDAANLYTRGEDQPPDRQRLLWVERIMMPKQAFVGSREPPAPSVV